MVSKRPDSAIVPSDGPVERTIAALIPCVDVRRGCGASGLKGANQHVDVKDQRRLLTLQNTTAR